MSPAQTPRARESSGEAAWRAGGHLYGDLTTTSPTIASNKPLNFKKVPRSFEPYVSMSVSFCLITVGEIVVEAQGCGWARAAGRRGAQNTYTRIAMCM